MTRKKTNLSSRTSRIYKTLRAYINVNRLTRQAQITFGDVWYSISRKEAAMVLKGQIG